MWRLKWFYFCVLLTKVIRIITSAEFELEVETPKSRTEWEAKSDVSRFTLTEGTTTRLKCQRNDEEVDSENISWTYIKCKFSECSGRGEPICSNNCKPWLLLDKIKMGQNGLYACYQTSHPATPGYTLEARLLMSYHITVIKGEIKSEPVFLESPNPTVKVMSMTRLTLTCRIMSLVPAIVRWFKQIPEVPRSKSESRNRSFIVYQNKTYQPLEWFPFEKKGNEFSGKLTINRTRPGDAGNYVCCVVTSQFGIQLREARVYVMPYIPPSKSKEDEIIYQWSQAEKIWTAAVLAVVVMVSCGWTVACCCGKLTSSKAAPRNNRQSGRRRRDPPPATTDTSDYEHDIALPHTVNNSPVVINL